MVPSVACLHTCGILAQWTNKISRSTIRRVERRGSTLQGERRVVKQEIVGKSRLRQSVRSRCAQVKKDNGRILPMEWVLGRVPRSLPSFVPGEEHAGAASAPVLHSSMARLGAQKAYELHCSRKSLTRPCSDMLPGSAENLPHVTFRWDSQRGGRGGLLFPILKAAGETRTCGFYAEMCLS